MSQIRAVARFRIHDGRGDEFRALVAEAVALVRANEPGTREYAWFVDEAGADAIVLEAYADAEALLAHSRNVGKLVGRMLQLADCTVDMLAEPTPEVLAMLKRMPLRLFGPLASAR